jgi:hypothetical protein
LCGLVLLLAVASSASPAAGAEGAACGGRPATITGTADADQITGTPGPDVIVGWAGDDEIRGLGGDDVICGGPGADLLIGGDGDDALRGQGGDDTLIGGPGDDLARGGWGDDDLAGKAGDDELNGGRGEDLIRGGHGADALAGRAGGDVLIGGDGFDVATGGRGVDDCDAEDVTRCEHRAMAPGAAGRSVKLLQQAMAERGLYRGPADGEFDAEVTAGVVAFHKLSSHPDGDTWSEADHVGRSWSLADWEGLLSLEPAPPKQRPNLPNRMEVDIGHQLLYLIEDDEVSAILPVSSGGEYWYGNQQYAHTPRGRHEFYRYVPGWQSNGQYESWYFESIFAVHGYRLVPPYPVSHGCVRVHLWDADWLSERLELGMTIFIWDE